MAKEGIDSFLLNCQLDEKFELIEAEFGLKGFAIVVKLLQRIYGEHGYYCEWNDDISLLLARQFGLSSGGVLSNKGSVGSSEQSCESARPRNLIDQVVIASVRRGIFDKTLFEKCNILTPKGIQKKYLDVTYKRKEIVLKKEYLLLSVGKNKGNVIIISLTDIKNCKNDVRLETSKVKESNKNQCADEPHANQDLLNEAEQLERDFEIIYKTYPKKRGRTVGFSNYKQWVSKSGKSVNGKRIRLTNRQIYLAIKKYVTQMESSGKDYEFWKNFDTLTGRQLLDYVDMESDK